MPKPGSRFSRSQIDTAWETARRHIELPNALSTSDLAALRAGPLECERAEHGNGSKPLFLVWDARGRRWVFKVSEAPLMAAEQAAYELRHLSGRPAILAQVMTLTLHGVGEVSGLLKPFVEFDSHAQLNSATQSWSALQRHVILVEHAWEWLLDNWDTNTSQYALLGPQAYPLNIDWDRALGFDQRLPLSRFSKYRGAIPNARTFLYADFVEGRIQLNFELLKKEVRHIRRLPDEPVRRILSRYTQVRFADPQARADYLKRFFRRKATIEFDFRAFISELKAERKRLRVARRGSLFDRTLLLGRLGWHCWQVALNATARGPIGKMGRRMLRHVRAKSAGVS